MRRPFVLPITSSSTSTKIDRHAMRAPGGSSRGTGIPPPSAVTRFVRCTSPPHTQVASTSYLQQPLSSFHPTNPRTHHRPWHSQPPRDAAMTTVIIGSGVAALSVAVRLIRRSQKVHLLAATTSCPPRCSDGAGGLWMPFHAGGEEAPAVVEKYLRWGQATYDELCRNARGEQNDDGHLPEACVVEMLEAHAFGDLSDGDDYWRSIVPDCAVVKNEGEHREYDKFVRFTAPVVDCPKVLAHYEQMLEQSQYCTITRTSPFENFSDVVSFVDTHIGPAATAIVNCAGANGAALSDGTDESKNFIARGVLHIYERDRKAETKVVLIDGGPLTGGPDYPAYAIPRGDVVIVGGSFVVDNASRTISEAEAARLTQNAELLLGEGWRERKKGEWVGFRPCREAGVRCEVDAALSARSNGRLVIHHYGHGGSGWTLVAGSSADVVDMLTKQRPSADVVHDTAARTFALGDSHLKYSIDAGRTTLDILHTHTARSMRGQGVAREITAVAFEYARSNKMKVRPTCSYVDTFVSKRPHYAKMLE